MGRFQCVSTNPQHSVSTCFIWSATGKQSTYALFNLCEYSSSIYSVLPHTDVTFADFINHTLPIVFCHDSINLHIKSMKSHIGVFKRHSILIHINLFTTPAFTCFSILNHPILRSSSYKVLGFIFF